MHPRRRTSLVLLAAVAAVAVASSAAPAAPTGVATFTNFRHPSDDDGAGEPTLGINRETNAVMYQSGLDTYTVTDFDDRTGEASWRTSNAILTSITSFDPMLTTDFESGRTFVSQLTLACSLMAYTDDDGRSWQEVPDGCGAGSFFDHQTVGTGAFVKGGLLRPVTSYNRAVYYCAQSSGSANCSTSLDGGLSFLPAVSAWTLATCSAIHGHLSSAPDGTVYLPPRRCGRQAGVAVSENNGLTWTVRRVPDSLIGHAKDPAIAAGADGTAYFSWGGLDGLDTVPQVAVTRDRGQTWTEPVTLGAEHGIRNTSFISAVAGDGDRAAIAFLGTRTGGPNQLETFDGVWRLYVALTYDRGATWRTVVATPESPVQVGKICTGGIACTDGTRNLLDFMDVTADAQGRVLVAFPDGCLEQMCDTRARYAAATVSRQSRGRGLYAAFDSTVR
ncbi:MAG TPA: sialidase family protein [Mycobacteriales bacterium]|nr:sialidase family protein [Mycobacteriales bacterium]